VGLNPGLGATPPNFTADLDVPFTQGSFGTSIPPAFAGFDPNSAANLSFAILSDIEAFFLIQAAQGDSRTNVLQAPKVTLFNGQQAFVADATQRPFVVGVIPVVGEFAAAQQPVIVVLNEGTMMTIQAVVSDDRRYVRMTIVPFFTQIGQVDTFTFEGSTSSTSSSSSTDTDDDGKNEKKDDSKNDAHSGVTVQLPSFSFISVVTTVSVPDGGTVLLGGIKRLSEGRNEFGVPLLSKIPYVNRLFKNVGIGRTTNSIMMMVTPRIIIQEEEEEKLGIVTP
jgi:general secretion pathway protein D